MNPKLELSEKEDSEKEAILKNIKDELATRKWVLVAELLLIFGLLYFFLPIGVYYLGDIIFPVIPFFSIYLVLRYPTIHRKKYNIFLCSFCFFLLILLGILEYTRLFPSYPNYPISEYMFPSLPTILIALGVGGVTFAIIGNKLNYFWAILSQRSEELEKKVKEKTKELEEAKTILEIKIRARTLALQEEKASLEERVEERTRELQEKIEELEKFQKAAVGRELKMIELKKEIKKLKTQ